MSGEVQVWRLSISGRVQGVGYRAWCVGAAMKLGLTGWVRNRLDGTVEALAEGPSADLEALREQCRVGPRFASVDTVAVEPGDRSQIDRSGFQQRPTE